MLYPVCVHQDGNGSLGAVVPDFPGCFSGADNWRDLPRMVQEAIEVHCEGEDLEVPVPSSLDELRDNPDYEGGQWVRRRSIRVLWIPVGEVPAATGADVDRAVRAGRGAFESEWGRMPIRERAGYLERLADRLHAHRDALGLMDCVDSGNALAGMVGDVDWTVDTLRYFAGLVTEIKGETSSYGPRHLNFTRRQPYGVVAKINPFNHPFRFCAEKAAAALAGREHGGGEGLGAGAAVQPALRGAVRRPAAAGGGERGHRRGRDGLGHGYVWINSTGRYIGVPYGGWKHSGVGREECFEELLSYTRIKNVNLRW